jgi:hypothetical protein
MPNARRCVARFAHRKRQHSFKNLFAYADVPLAAYMWDDKTVTERTVSASMEEV